MDLPILIIGVITGVFILLNFFSIDKTTRHFVRERVLCHRNKQISSNTAASAPAGEVELQSVVVRETSDEKPDEEVESPAVKEGEFRYIDAVLYIVPIVLIFGLYTAYRAEYYSNFEPTYTKTISK